MHNWGTFFKEVTLLFFPPITPYYIYIDVRKRGATQKSYFALN